MAPEIVYKKAYDYRVDTWSLGVLLYELIHKEAPYKGRTINEIMQSLSKGSISFKAGIDPQAKELIQKILRVTPADRPAISQILSHPWVKAHTEPQDPSKNIFNTFSIEPPSTREKTVSRGVEREHLDSASSSTANTVQSKSRKLSNMNIPASSRSNIRIKRPVDEVSSDTSLRHHTKSSCSIGKNVLEILECTDDRKPATPLELYRKRRMLASKVSSGNVKRSLHSLISPTNFNPLKDHDLVDYAISPFSSVISPTTGSSKSIKNATPAHNRIMSLADAHFSSGHSTSLNGFISTNPSMTLDASELPMNATMGSTTTPISFKQIDKMRTPDLTRRVRTVTTLNGSRSSKMTTSANNDSYEHGGSSSRAKQHPKTLTVISENVNPRRPVVETRTNSSSMSNRSLYKGARQLVSPRYLDVSTSGSETAKALSSDIKRFISPTISSTRADFVGRVKTEMPRLDGYTRDTGLSQKDTNLLSMNKRPVATHEKRGNNEKESSGGFSFNKFLPGGSYGAKLVATATEDNVGVKGSRPFVKERANSGKENKLVDDRLLRSSGNLDRFFTPRELQSIRYKN